MGILLHVTLLVLPNVHVTNTFNESGSAKLCRIMTAALATYPKIIPNTKMVIESLIREETNKMSKSVSAAPAIAAIT
jgi:hypothetical protein